MMFAPYPLQASNRRLDEDLSRYIRNEYRDDNSCWFTANGTGGGCLRLPGEKTTYTVPNEEPCCQNQLDRSAGCRCPVMNAVSGRKAASEPKSAGGGYGRP
ncbi:MAG: hypothetical protein JSU93_01740 [Methanobacteriota archaeon]|nr:MAG: hypothetical protein JSU93_01740 [Euryarchaeota archaeon]